MNCVLGVLLSGLGLLAPGDWDSLSSRVGVPVQRTELVLPGSLLEVAEISDETPVILRIAAASPHGSAWRYDLEWYGLQPGRFDLAALLRRQDGTPVSDLPALPVEIVSGLPPGQVQPSAPESGALPAVGGYSTVLLVAAVFWLAGLLGLGLLARRHRARREPLVERPVTVAERLQPLLRRALEGRLDPAARAQLELALITYWRRRLGLQGDAAEALARLRSHPEAGPLLTALEQWLHRPDPPADVDLAMLLRPYHDLVLAELPEPLPANAG